MAILRAIYPDVQQNGIAIAVVYAEPHEVERWLRYVCHRTERQFDWRFEQNLPHVVYVGTEMERISAKRHLEQYQNLLNGKLSTNVMRPALSQTSSVR